MDVDLFSIVYGYLHLCRYSAVENYNIHDDIYLQQRRDGVCLAFVVSLFYGIDDICHKSRYQASQIPFYGKRSVKADFPH